MRVYVRTTFLFISIFYFFPYPLLLVPAQAGFADVNTANPL